MKLEFAPFCSSSYALSDGMIFSKRRDATSLKLERALKCDMLFFVCRSSRLHEFRS